MHDLASKFDISENELSGIFAELERSGMINFHAPSTGTDCVKMLAPRTAVNRLNIDFNKINERYLFAQRKLELMRDFVFSNDCRFRFILEYFSESIEGYSCKKCDNCHSPSITDASIQYLNEIVLKTLKDFEDGLNEPSLFTLLTGTSKSPEFKKNNQYGICRQYKRHELFPVLHALEMQGFIKRSVKEKKKLLLTNKGLLTLVKTGAVEVEGEINHYEENLELYHQLRELRTNAAAKFNQSPFLICSDELLREIALIRPDVKYELLQIPGFHDRMYNKFGDEILETIKEFKRTHSKAESGTDGKQNASLAGNLEETYRMVKDGYQLKEIAELRKNE